MLDLKIIGFVTTFLFVPICLENFKTIALSLHKMGRNSSYYVRKCLFTSKTGPLWLSQSDDSSNFVIIINRSDRLFRPSNKLLKGSRT